MVLYADIYKNYDHVYTSIYIKRNEILHKIVFKLHHMNIQPVRNELSLMSVANLLLSNSIQYCVVCTIYTII